MESGRILKRIHAGGTIWLILCAVYLIIVALYQAGFRWWEIFSLSAYSGIAFFLLLIIYLYAVFRGVVRKQMTVEHPLTTSLPYIALYDCCPFLGCIAGLISLPMIPNIGWLERFNLLAEGTLGMTFFFWIICDPLIGSFESLLPASRASRKKRIAEAHRLKAQKEREKKQMLEDIVIAERTCKQQWDPALRPLAQELAGLLGTTEHPDLRIQAQAIEKGARAWQLGGIPCMKYLHEQVQQIFAQNQYQPPFDYLACWWDGIGTWRKPPLPRFYEQPYGM